MGYRSCDIIMWHSCTCMSCDNVIISCDTCCLYAHTLFSHSNVQSNLNTALVMLLCICIWPFSKGEISSVYLYHASSQHSNFFRSHTSRDGGKTHSLRRFIHIQDRLQRSATSTHQISGVRKVEPQGAVVDNKKQRWGLVHTLHKNATIELCTHTLTLMKGERWLCVSTMFPWNTTFLLA